MVFCGAKIRNSAPFAKLSRTQTMAHNPEKTHEDECEKIIAQQTSLSIP
jgi:hypothetical protein